MLQAVGLGLYSRIISKLDLVWFLCDVKVPTPFLSGTGMRWRATTSNTTRSGSWTMVATTSPLGPSLTHYRSWWNTTQVHGALASYVSACLLYTDPAAHCPVVRSHFRLIFFKPFDCVFWVFSDGVWDGLGFWNAPHCLMLCSSQRIQRSHWKIHYSAADLLLGYVLNMFDFFMGILNL